MGIMAYSVLGDIYIYVCMYVCMYIYIYIYTLHYFKDPRLWELWYMFRIR